MVFARSHTECINAFFPHTYSIYATNGHTVKCSTFLDRPLYMFIVSECRKLLVIAWWHFFYCSLYSRTLCVYLLITILSRFYLTLVRIIFYNILFPNSILQLLYSLYMTSMIVWLNLALFIVCHTLVIILFRRDRNQITVFFAISVAVKRFKWISLRFAVDLRSSSEEGEKEKEKEKWYWCANIILSFSMFVQFIYFW